MNSSEQLPSVATGHQVHPTDKKDFSLNTTSHATERRKNHVVKIYSPELEESTFNVEDPLVNGRDVAELTGVRSADDYVVLQVLLPNHATEERRLEEKFELDPVNNNIFLVGKADGTLNAVIDGMRVAWFNLPITANALLFLAGKDDDFVVFQEVQGQASKLIASEEVVSLRGDGIEHFRTEKIKKKIIVYLAEVRHEISSGTYTTEHLKQTLGVAETYVLDLIGEDGTFIELKPGQHLEVKNGMKFVSYLPTGHSS